MPLDALGPPGKHGFHPLQGYRHTSIKGKAVFPWGSGCAAHPTRTLLQASRMSPTTPLFQMREVETRKPAQIPQGLSGGTET